MRIAGIAIATIQVATGEADEDAGHAAKGRFSLNAIEYFADFQCFQGGAQIRFKREGRGSLCGSREPRLSLH